MFDTRFRSLWEQLQGKKAHMPHFLSEIQLDGIRGINNLRVVFDYPVSVIAGGNASGKSTVLFAAACAYKVQGAGVRDFVPSTLFPDYDPKVGQRKDERRQITLQFDYSTPEGRLAMQWQRNKSWNRSYFGRPGGTQPERQVYLRTLSNLSNPSEVRGVLSMSRLNYEPDVEPLTALQVDFAGQMLPFRYSEVVDLSSGKKNLLFASHEGGPQYSELHMAAGERSILRLSQEIAHLDGALVLIDEVEAGLHPWAQQLLMVQLQQLALRRNLQIILTSHSPVVLDSVPPNGRIFLERADDGRVSVAPPYRDIVQDALYGRSADALNLLCEDEEAEGILRGVFEHLLPRLRVSNESVRIGRDTGADQFPQHAAAFRKFGQIHNFVFVLDGDKRESGSEDSIRRSAQSEITVLFLPGQSAPEVWVWDQLRERRDRMAAELGVSSDELASRMDQYDSIYDSQSTSASEIAKSKLRDLAAHLARDVPTVCRTVARVEAAESDSDIQPLVVGLEDALAKWRAE